MRPSRNYYARRTTHLTPKLRYSVTDFSQLTAKIPTNERETMKLASLFFKASAGYFRDLSQRYKKRAKLKEKNRVTLRF